MSDGNQKKGLALRPFAPAALVVLGFLGVRFTNSGPWRAAYDFVDRVLFKAFGGFPAAQEIAAYTLRHFEQAFTHSYGFVLAWGTFLVPLAFLARMLARSRIRAGGTDPLERMRGWTREHPYATRAIGSIPVLFWGLGLYLMFRHRFDAPLVSVLPPVLAAIFGVNAVSRAGLRAFLQPTLDATEESRIEIGPDEIVFDAVAVTRETRAAVGALAGLSLAMVVWLAALPILTLFRDARLFAAVAAYVAVAIGSAALFRRASRVAVGVDGVLVKGTSRTRFYAYRDLDAARVSGGDLELLRKDRVVLRLQLHGQDAVRRDAVCARIQENVARVKEGRHAVAAQLVASASREQLARVASGGADYRAASLSREALAKTSDDGERKRLRVAAEHCADPQVRVALEQMAEAEPIEEHVDRPKQAASPT